MTTLFNCYPAEIEAGLIEHPAIAQVAVIGVPDERMLSVPGAKTVRGFSQFGDSYVYVIFEDGTDPYWARSRDFFRSTIARG